MGDDMYNNYDKNPSSSSSSQDEISLFLRQILLRSSSSAASRFQTRNNSMPLENAHPSSSSFPSSSSPLHDGKISAQLGSTAGATPGFLSALGAYGSMKGHGGSAANVSSSSVGVSENDTDDYDCESEEGGEALAEEIPTKPVPCRSSSKRSRAAEVHNLSEKRRRSRINEKMKALQNLIPNSNKTDKASMLDEAIEYLKQLQLQVQMLSMRNGLSLHPMCFPEGLQSLQFSRMSMELSEENRAIPLNMTDALPLHQGDPLLYSTNLPNKPTMPNQLPVTYPSCLHNSQTSFGLESPILPHIKPLQPGRSSEAHREDILQHQQSTASHSDTNPLGCSQAPVVKEFEPGTLATASLPFDMQTTEAKDNSSLQTCIAGRDQSAVIIRNS